MRKGQRIKADIIGPNAQSGRFPAMSAVAHAPNPVKCWCSRVVAMQTCLHVIARRNDEAIQTLKPCDITLPFAVIAACEPQSPIRL